MKGFSVILVASAATLVLSGAAWQRGHPTDSREPHVRRETARLRAHFDSVGAELRGADISRLSAQQLSSRTKLISWLRAYRNAGTFPTNDRFADRWMPFFRDSHGTLCAMAYLVDRSGRGDIVDHIAKTRNNAFIRELTDDRSLVAWLEESGLTVDEAARIQPQYSPFPPVIVDDDKQVSANYALLSMGLGGASLGSLALNVVSPSRASGGFGLMAGVAAIVAGAAHLEDPIGNKRVAIANTAVGSVSTLVALHTMFARRGIARQALVDPSRAGLVSEATLSPDLFVIGSAPRFGVRVNAKF